MILVHEKNKTTDPYGAQAEIMAFVAKDRRNSVAQPAIEAHILARCQCLAISALEHLVNSGALVQPEGSPTIFQLSPAGIDWCRTRGIKVLSMARYQIEEDQDGRNEPEGAEPAPAPKKRGRPRRVAPAPD